MKKLTTSVLAVVLTSSFVTIDAQKVKKDTVKTKDIEGVVITGALGIKKKADAVTSTQQVVNAEQLNQAGNSNAIQALAGKVSGLQIDQTNSGVQDSNSIVLRGRRSITGNNQALVVIDNVISSASVFQQLPPEVIESVNVIKGAQGAALYGAQGVNGVIIVNTKNGTKNGKINVSYSGTVDFQTVAYLPKRQRNYGQGWDGLKINVENGAWGPAFSDSKWKDRVVPYGLPLYDYDGNGEITFDASDYTEGGDSPASIFSKYAPFGRDNVKDFFNVGSIFSNDITLNAGENGKYALLSLGHMRRDFVVQDDRLDRTSALFKGGVKMGKWTVEGSFNYIKKKMSETDSGLYHDLLQSSADAPITMYKNYPDVAFAWNVYYRNPYWVIKHIRYNNQSNFFNATAGIGYELNKNISVKYTANLQNTTTTGLRYGDDWDNYMSPSVKGQASWLYKSGSFTSNYYGDLIVNFDYDINDNINLKANVGHNYQDRTYNVNTAGGDLLDVPGLYTVYNIKKPAIPSSLSNGEYHMNSYAFFANVDLAYRDFLFLNATARNEWSSVLPKNNNSYFYPSVGLSFVPTKAFKGFGGNVLNYMKLSANWTKVGNSSSIGWYDVNPYAVVGSGYPYSRGGLSFVNQTGPTSENIRPEFVISKEVSVNLGFFKDRITLSGSVYQQDTKDLITYQSTSNTSGITRSLINVGEMRTKGFEVDLGLTPVRSRDFKWELNFSYARAESEILKVTDDSDEVNLGSNSMVGIYAKKGWLFPLIKANAYQRDENGRVIVNYNTGNPLYTQDLREFGTTAPKHILGFTTSLEFKGLRLGAVLDYRTGHYFFAGVAADMAFNGGLYESGQFDRNQGGFVMPNSSYKDPVSGAYTPNTTVKTGGNSYADVSTYYSSIYNRIGENFIIDATALKVRELSLSYTLPKELVKNSGLREVTFGLHARNPFIKLAKDNLNYNDPETSNTTGNAQGYASGSQYPSVKTYGMSLNVKF
ncbi:SusC/RagA family TonB-linked outer membrane protein [Riemerella anatipestifer]|uniref:SusC/RagA family TonB-linked outer membrane protein n=1 Tax=Riemerella anatipestifer TaxID=34085 RepID=UPI00129D72B4|nr:SusC/RagA family TonB-linked outer membrane protein [Riemerella anatipestifer]MRM83789.1 SusC/RagA family TonB-linked outer membrane protein [Riemerella anatipestifer]